MAVLGSGVWADNPATVKKRSRNIEFLRVEMKDRWWNTELGDFFKCKKKKDCWRRVPTLCLPSYGFHPLLRVHRVGTRWIVDTGLEPCASETLRLRNPAPAVAKLQTTFHSL
jgi:hypothetical protein